MNFPVLIRFLEIVGKKNNYGSFHFCVWVEGGDCKICKFSHCDKPPSDKLMFGTLIDV